MTCHSVKNNTRMGLVTYLCSNSNHLISLISPQTVSNFRHLLSCGTVEKVPLVLMIYKPTSVESKEKHSNPDNFPDFVNEAIH